MAIPYLSPIDLNKLELLNAAIQNLSGDPASPATGQVYFNTTDGTIREYTGSAWRIVSYVGATAPTAETVGATASNGTSNEAARADHRHAMPGNATTGADGFMSSTDKTKLDNAVSAATASRLVIRDASGRAQFADPSASADAATKNYVDNLVNGTAWKNPVRVATTAALAITARTATTLTIGGTSIAIDGITLANADRVLVKNGTTGTGAGTHDNGIYTVSGVGSSIVLTRTSDADSWTELVNAAVYISVGTANADTSYVSTVDAGGTVGTTTVSWSPVGSSVADGSISNAKLADMAQATVKGRAVGAGTGAPVDLTAAQVKAIVDSVGIFKADVGDGTSTAIVVTHNLGTRDVLVEVFRNASPWETVRCDVERTSTTTITLRFAVAPTSNQFRVVVEA